MVNDTEEPQVSLAPHIEAVTEVAEKLTATLAAPARARQIVADALNAWQIPPSVVRDAELIVSELAANAVQHTGSPSVRVFCLRGDHLVRIAVHDFSREQPMVVVTDSLDDERGRGMRLVAAYALRWGVDAAIVGKVVWAELAIPRSRRR